MRGPGQPPHVFMPLDSSCRCSLPKSARPTTANFNQTIRSIMGRGQSPVCSLKVSATSSASDSELEQSSAPKSDPNRPSKRRNPCR